VKTPPPPRRRSARRPRPTLGTTLELDLTAPSTGGVPDASAGNKIEPAPAGVLCVVASCISRRRRAEVTVTHLGIGGRIKWPYCSYHAWPYRPKKAR
jgi:hypothetical protein